MERVNLNLCLLPFLDTSYKNVIDFKDKESRDRWFNNAVARVTTANIKYDCNRTSVVVTLLLQEANNFDYLFYDGPDRRYFYFITSIEYNTFNTTILGLELDVFNTYYYDVFLNNSFVERMHVDRWNGDIPTYNVEDEGLSIGEYRMLEDPTELYKMNKGLVIASSVPIGITETSSGSGSGSTGGAMGGTSWRDGKISSQAFRFIKGFEGFCATPYQDSGGYWTIGYGTTLHGEPDTYNELASKAPITEEEAARVMYDHVCNKYGKRILDACINLGVTEQYQFDALVSLAYNSGVGSVTNENSLTRVIGSDINNTDAIMETWQNFKVTSEGIYLEGLKLRRIEESNMFAGLPFEVRPIMNVDGDGWLPQDDSYVNNDSEEGYNGHGVVSNDGGSGWLIPVTGATCTSPYGWRNCPFHGREMHPGIDLACPTGTPVLAPKSGTVKAKGFHDSMGNYIYIQHENGILTKYMHLSAFSCEAGDTVARCQEIGKVGSTGDSTGPHLHWEFRDSSDNSFNPIPGHATGNKY